MKPSLLFPPIFKIIGVMLLIPGLVLWYLYLFRYYEIPFLSYGPNNPFGGNNNFTDETFVTLVVVGLLFIGFSKLKNETGATNQLRLKALYWSMLVNGILLETSFIYSLLGELLKIPEKYTLPEYYGPYNLFIFLFIFVFQFYYLLYKIKKGNVRSTDYLPYKPYNSMGKTISILFILLIFLSVIGLLKINLGGDTLMFITVISFPFILIWIGSKEKKEDELITNIRLKAVQITVLINYGLFLLATWIVYGSDYLDVLLICLYSIPVIFIFVFRFLLFKKSKTANHFAAL